MNKQKFIDAGVEEFCCSKYMAENFNFGDFPPEDESHYENYKEELLFGIKKPLENAITKVIILLLKELNKPTDSKNTLLNREIWRKKWN